MVAFFECSQCIDGNHHKCHNKTKKDLDTNNKFGGKICTCCTDIKLDIELNTPSKREYNIPSLWEVDDSDDSDDDGELPVHLL